MHNIHFFHFAKQNLQFRLVTPPILIGALVNFGRMALHLPRLVFLASGDYKKSYLPFLNPEFPIRIVVADMPVFAGVL
jgi:hypothetical protein